MKTYNAVIIDTISNTISAHIIHAANFYQAMQKAFGITHELAHLERQKGNSNTYYDVNAIFTI